MKLTIKKFFPFLIWWPLVNRRSLRADLIAGLTGAVIVLPQGIAFATIAGLPPVYGLYTAMVTPIIAALFGSSRHLISGPTTAISIVVLSSLSGLAEPGSKEFISLALTLTFLAGIYQLAFGLARLGNLVNFVSHTVVIGFTAGAAILIITSQSKYVLGINLPASESFAYTWFELAKNLTHTNLYVLAVALLTLIVAVVAKKYFSRSPNLLFGMVAGSVLAWLLGGEQHGLKMISDVPGQLPAFSLPNLSPANIRALAPQAFAIALLGLIEAVSISRAIASKSMQRIDGNQEFIGQGLSNIIGSFFSSYAGSGSFTRSGINYTAGAITPLSAIFAALSLMIIVLLVAPLMSHLPLAAMGGVILLVAYNLIDLHHIKKIFMVSRTETAILLVTFFATLFLELEFAIYLGVLLSLLLFLNRTSTPDMVILAPDPYSPSKMLTNVERKALLQCPQLKIIRIDMSIYFGSVNHIQKTLHDITDKEGIRHILIVATSINFVDLAGAEMLAQEAKRLRQMDGGLYFCSNKKKVCSFLDKGGFIDDIGKDNFFGDKAEAINTIYKRLNRSICIQCKNRIFDECKQDPVLQPTGTT